jgi:hypothetical protein
MEGRFMTMTGRKIIINVGKMIIDERTMIINGRENGSVGDFVCAAVHGLTKSAVHTERTAKRSA